MAHILVVDDDADMRALVRGALERDGHAVTALACGAQVTQMCIRDRDRAALARAEALRAEVVPRVERFLDAARGQTAAGISKQLSLLLDRCV